MQLWQQNMTYKQLQELQQQQQLHQLDEERQQNAMNQHSAAGQQATEGPLPLFINGTPVRDAPYSLMNLMQRGPSPSPQGFPNRQAFPPEQNQNMRSMMPQQLHHGSLHGTPVGSAGGNESQYSNLKGMSRDSMSFLSHAGGNGSQPPIIHSSTFGNSFPRNHGVSMENVNASGGGFLSGQGFQMKNDFGQVPLSHENFLQMNSSLPEFSSRQDLTGNSEIMHQSTTQLGLSQSLVPLDPLEQKILFNMDDDGWDTGFGRSMEAEAGGFGSAMEQSDFSSAFQSGSWSALMQSAVAEASNTDTGTQEKSSGLTFQNTELSTNNTPSNFINEERRQTGWVDNNLQSAPSSSKSFPMFNDSSMKSNFPGFQQSDFQSSTRQGEGPRQYEFNESFQRSPRNAGEWLDCNPQHSNQSSQQIEPLKQLENVWAGHNYDHSERDAQQRRMTSHNNIGEQFSKQKGDANGAIYKERDRWPGQLEQQNSHNGNPMRKDSQAVHFGSVHKAAASKAQLEVGKRTQENPDYTKHFVNNCENDTGGKVQQQRTSPQNFGNSYDGARKSFENFNDSYNSKGFSGPKQGLGGQFSIVGNNSKNSMHSDKKCLPNFQGNSKALDDAVYGGDLGSSTSTTFGRPAGSDRQNAALQTSVHMLDLLHKVDQSREDGHMAHFGSTNQNSLSEMPKANTQVDQFDQSSASHGFGLKLAPPAQRLPNSNCFPPAQDLQIANNLNPSQANSESGFKNQGWLDSTSARSLPPNQFSQRARQDDTSTNLGQTHVSSYMNMHANSDATLASGSSHFRNQPQVQHMHNNVRVVGESSQATQAGTSGRFGPFNTVSSQETSQQTSTNHGQPFPILETSISRPSIMSSMSQNGGMLGTHQNAWKNVPTSQFPSAFSSMDPSKNRTEEPLRSSQGGLNDQISLKGRMISQDLGASSVNSQGSEYGEEQQRKQRSRHEISSELQDSSQSGGLFDGQETAMKHIPAHSDQKDRDSFHEENNGSAASKRNLASFDCLLKPSQTLDKNGTLLHQIQAMKNSRETDSSKRHNEVDVVTKVQQVSDSAGKQLVPEHDLNVRNHMHVGPNSLQPSSSPSRDAKMLSLLSNAREELSGKSLSQPTTQPSPQSGKFNQNGQTLQTYDASPAKTAMEQFSAGKASQNIPINTSADQVSAAVSRQVGSILPSPTASLVASENFPAPHVLPSDLANQSGDNIRIKKRKTMKSPWHVEVTQGSDRLPDISMAEQEWARATNHLVEKAEYGIESIGEGHQTQHQPKRRLILTTRLMQNILRPAPASVLLGDASSRCDSVPYFVAKLALGDACSLANCSINEPHAALDNKDMTSEKHRAFDSDKHLTNVMQGFAERAKKLENDFSRLESSSILDLRLDYQDLERNCVINRFAKFHMRGQAITSGTSHSGTTMTALIPGPQRYVTAFPMPRELPEGSQCFSM